MGLMGAVAETVAAGLGNEFVIGVIPEALAPREVRPGQTSCLFYSFELGLAESYCLAVQPGQGGWPRTQGVGRGHVW